MTSENDEKKNEALVCLACGIEITDPKPDNKMGDEFICNNCREQMMTSLEEAWKKHSAFLDAALN
ncbi:MAG: hypothetical protein OK439_07550 [Thaumarchaeota archaeon]|nr:hypothetical protein [Nitrososphaerota archaeon]